MTAAAVFPSIAVADGEPPARRTRAPARPRKLHLGHFAFMRAVVQGIDPRASWDRYLRIEGDHTDARVVRSTIQWIRDEFAAAAKREARPGTARLVVMDFAQIGEPAAKLPSLEAFSEEQGLTDFSQAEQIAAFEAAFGKLTQRLQRRSRLIERQLDALRWLEALIAEPPLAGDAVASWFQPVLAQRLEATGLMTLAQLLERINGIGRRWHATIPAIGQAKADRIERWLAQHAATIGIAIGTHVAVPRTRLFGHELARVTAPATAIRPLEKLIVPAGLDGSNGLYRRPQAQCLLAATNDYEAILTWLRSKHALDPTAVANKKRRRRQRGEGIEQPSDWLNYLSHTQRAYRKEAERFLLWAIIVRGKPLSSMTQEDCIAYRDFLADPQPRSQWCGDRGRERWSPLWRPFAGPLSAAAQRQAVTILRNLYAYLVDQNYLMGNPWTGVLIPRSSQPSINAGRSLSQGQWTFVERQLKTLEETSANQRLRLALHLLYATGLRLSEIVAARVGDLRWVSYSVEPGDPEPVEGWVLSVVGKGGRLREVPVPIDVVGELARYLESRGLDVDPEAPENAARFVLARASGASERLAALTIESSSADEDGIAAGTLYGQVKAFFAECARALERGGDAKGAGRLAAASTHWLRHTHASHAIAGGMPIEVAQQNLGHASLATTTVYVRTEERRRMRAVEKFWSAVGAGKTTR